MSQTCVQLKECFCSRKIGPLSQQSPSVCRSCEMSAVSVTKQVLHQTCSEPVTETLRFAAKSLLTKQPRKKMENKLQLHLLQVEQVRCLCLSKVVLGRGKVIGGSGTEGGNEYSAQAHLCSMLIHVPTGDSQSYLRMQFPVLPSQQATHRLKLVKGPVLMSAGPASLSCSHWAGAGFKFL